MSLQDYYRETGGDYENVKGRLLDDARIEKFLNMFLESDYHETIHAGLQSGDLESAFRSAHTLKGTAADIGMVNIHDDAVILTELLRPVKGEETQYDMKAIKAKDDDLQASWQDAQSKRNLLEA